MRRILLILLLLPALLCPIPARGEGPARLAFSGGPDGGTFNYFANGIATRLNRKMPDEFRVELKTSAGSVENIRRVDAGEADFAIVYSGDVWLARRGALADDPKEYRNVLALAFLYGAPAHLVVPADSAIQKVDDLAGHRVAIGPSGSGAATAAGRYFSALGLARDIRFEMIGYNLAAQALLAGKVDAMWVVAGYPNASVTQLAAKTPVRLLDLWTENTRRKIEQNYPFYSGTTIPAGTYIGQDRDIATFQDAAIWVASNRLPANRVEKALTEIYTPEGLAYMAKVKKTARQMSIAGGLDGVVIPLHPGADAFWRSKGLTPIPAR
ncbi:MAG: TAXI family TRAP transporter solute-binding subunit [Deltaproteobacteria bacterium]|nr:MAG: TAXI family TRAP transporter solute-binding subunit [Deltaproteobacteria bacterium]